ncbi:MAG: DUF3224 domain-containing protein, partial [Solirubrobacteraceae bacterium]
EHSTHEVSGGPKLTRVHLTNTYHGSMEGEGAADAVLLYLEERSGHYVGLEHLVARIGDRAGAFALRHVGTFSEDGRIEADSMVVEGSGTGDLAGLHGRGHYASQIGEPTARFTLEHDRG